MPFSRNLDDFLAFDWCSKPSEVRLESLLFDLDHELSAGRHDDGVGPILMIISVFT